MPLPTQTGTPRVGGTVWNAMVAFVNGLENAITGMVASNDSRLTDQRVPTNGSVTDAKVATNAAISMDKTADSGGRFAFTAGERTKLSSVAQGATANSSDAYLLDRGNQTGVQPITSVTGLQSALDGRARPRGSWTANTDFFTNDMFDAPNGALFLVTAPHRSGATAPTADFSVNGVPSARIIGWRTQGSTIPAGLSTVRTIPYAQAVALTTRPNTTDPIEAWGATSVTDPDPTWFIDGDRTIVLGPAT